MSLDKPAKYCRYVTSIDTLITALGTVTFGTIARVYLTPIQIPFTLTVDRLAWIQNTVSAGNVRQGLYRDMGDTPLGGPLVVESASVAKAGTNRKMELTIAPAQLSPGLYWLAIQSDEVTSNFDTVTMECSNGGTLMNYYYDRGGGYGAFTNPCPAITQNNNGAVQYVRVKSIP